jgi:hypothetical protein
MRFILSKLYDKNAVKILFETYWTTGGWRNSYTTPPEDLAYAISKGVMFPPALFPHGATLRRLRRVCKSISPAEVGNAFLTSLTMREPVLRSALGSFAVARSMPDHGFTPDIVRCRICKLALSPTESDDLNVLSFERMKWGGVRHADAGYQLFDLEEFRKLAPPQPTADDMAIFHRILATIRSLPAKATAGHLEKALAGVVPSNKNERRQMIEVLCLSGVIAYPSYRDIFDDTTPPSDRRYRDTDWGIPAMYWRARDGYSAERVKEYFAKAVPKA